MLHIKNLKIIIEYKEKLFCYDKINYMVDTHYFNTFYLSPNFLELIESKKYDLHKIKTITFHK